MKLSLCLSTLILMVGAQLGCKGQESKAPTPSAPVVALEDQVTPETLAAADELDGQVDKVVEKCPACMMKMKGKPQIATQVHGYAVHSCTDMCKEAFEKDPQGLLNKGLKK